MNRDEISLKDAAEYVGIYTSWLIDDDGEEVVNHSVDGVRVSRFKSGAESEAVLDAMLAAGRRGKTIRPT